MIVQEQVLVQIKHPLGNDLVFGDETYDPAH